MNLGAIRLASIDMTKIHVGACRDDAKGSMQVVSGVYGREKVHYTAPPAERVAQEMAAFHDWFNKVNESDPKNGFLPQTEASRTQQTEDQAVYKPLPRICS